MARFCTGFLRRKGAVRSGVWSWCKILDFCTQTRAQTVRVEPSFGCDERETAGGLVGLAFSLFAKRAKQQ
jgi:hypothetical protein